ncbi:MAG: CDP-diacylglycerol--glycerol-3-phosphate 3-phosphatidyltransferase [Clostridia bacterium]|nr:CDP-diacylglycerol--glycerol-3-phosphate 3-phosphatidyltransferase [Clostridia bacterium]
MSKMNLPNKLTMLRLFMVPVIMVFLLLPDSVIPWIVAHIVGFVLFVITAVTDMLDGKIARKHQLITNFGKFMDPVADKFMVIGILLTMLFRMVNSEIYGCVEYSRPFMIVYFVAVVLIIFRELAITSLRLVLVGSNGTVVAANMLGKIKTCAQIACIGALFVEPLLNELLCRTVGYDWVFAGIYPITWLGVGVMLIFTIWSAANYIKGGWSHISSDW